ncbi:MAG: hypothetical protein WC943_02055 [Elusimicrobiota bacterium]
MTLNPYAEDPRGSSKPVYEVTDSGLSFVEKTSPPKAAPVPAKPVLGSIVLQLSLLGALLAYFLDGKEWYSAAERVLEDRARARMVEPYRFWAQTHPQTYEDVTAAGPALAGKSVLWEFGVDASSGAASYYCEGDPAKRVVWASGEALLREKAAAGAPLKALARLDGLQGDRPLLTFLE